MIFSPTPGNRVRTVRAARIFTCLFFACLLLSVTAVEGAGGSGLRIIRDAEIEKGLKTFGAPVFQEAGVSPASVKFIIVENHQLNAFVAGGQNIFLYTGLILNTDSPAELVGVIAHETGHIALGHLLRGQIAAENLSFQAILASVLGVAAGVMAGSSGAGVAVASAGQSMALNSMLSHSRTQESAADHAGVRFLNGAHITLAGFVSFMEKLKDQELLPSTSQSEYVRTHPLTQDRVEFLRHAPSKTNTVPAGWGRMHARIHAKLLGYLEPGRALQNKGTTIEVRYAHAIAYYRRGTIDRALPLIEALVKEEPDNAYFHELKGQVLFETGRVQESLASYARAVALAPEAGLIRMAYGHALLETPGGKKGNLDEAVRQLHLALETEPLEPRPHYFLALVYGKQGKEGLSRLHLAEKYALENRKDLAEREARLALKHLPPKSAAVQRASDILEIVGDQKTAKEKKGGK